MSKKEKKLTSEENVSEVNDKTVKRGKPTEEEIAQFKADFDKSIEEFNNTKWDISEKGTFAANDVAIFITDFMKKFALWSKNGWMGMLKMKEELDHELSEVTEETCLSLNYQALEFCSYMLANPGGVGYELAKEFENIAEKYAKIGIHIGKKVEEARKMLKDIQYKQEKYGAAIQGCYLEDLHIEEKPDLENNLGEIKVNPDIEK